MKTITAEHVHIELNDDDTEPILRTCPGPYLSAALIKPIMAVFNVTSWR